MELKYLVNDVLARVGRPERLDHFMRFKNRIEMHALRGSSYHSNKRNSEVKFSTPSPSSSLCSSSSEILCSGKALLWAASRSTLSAVTDSLRTHFSQMVSVVLMLIIWSYGKSPLIIRDARSMSTFAALSSRIMQWTMPGRLLNFARKRLYISMHAAMKVMIPIIPETTPITSIVRDLEDILVD